MGGLKPRAATTLVNAEPVVSGAVAAMARVAGAGAVMTTATAWQTWQLVQVLQSVVACMSTREPSPGDAAAWSGHGCSAWQAI